jgi:cytosine/adenosine deaminase-related metal-dependent hydrolase
LTQQGETEISAAPAGAFSLRADHLLARPGHELASGPGIVRVQDGRILSLGDAGPCPEGHGLLAMPALCNAHDHGRGLSSLAFGADDDALELWLPSLAAEPMIDPYLRAATAFARMAESGICAANHCHNPQDGSRLLQEAHGVARAAQDVGIRVSFALPFFDRNRFVYGDTHDLLHHLPAEDHERTLASSTGFTSVAERLALAESIAEWESPFFVLQYGPVGPQWVSDRGMELIASESARTGRRVHMHLFETRLQREWADAQYSQGYLRYLDEIGLLTSRLTLAHCVWLRQDEIELLAERGVTVSINASSNLRLQSGIAPAAAYLSAGLRWGIGLDGMALDDDEDMLREIRLLRHLARATSGAPISDANLFDAALRIGRKTIVGDDGGGAIEAGAPADILVLDFAAMTQDVIAAKPDPSPILLGRMTRGHVRRLMVAGRMIVEDGACRSVDRPALERELRAQARSAGGAHDTAYTARLRSGLAAFYACGCHKKGKHVIF